MSVSNSLCDPEEERANLDLRFSINFFNQFGAAFREGQRESPSSITSYETGLEFYYSMSVSSSLCDPEEERANLDLRFSINFFNQFGAAFREGQRESPSSITSYETDIQSTAFLLFPSIPPRLSHRTTTLTLNPISTPPHSRSLDFAASSNCLSGSSLRQFPLTRFSLPSSSSSNYLNGWISTPPPDRDREPRGVEATAAESCAGEAEDKKASGLSKTLELGSLFGLGFLFNIYLNIYNKQVDDCSLSSLPLPLPLPLPWKRQTQDHHSKLPSIAHHNLHFYLLLLGFSFDQNLTFIYFY
ncbi:hypothetical protein RHSIM_Rhsim10G0118100 [Rhododendron simsii]|uniref:Uncharacterized protein n=1 Tax=Rhododendron simsii TaxID=118357 RepID=A0A834LDH0_RHOSS|nr:hypothetical protein RHSIM_Rhsim10G0118100 [Rhododendron simsii]